MKPIREFNEANGSAFGSDETSRANNAKSRFRLSALILFIILTTTFSLYCAMITPNRFGDYGDDGTYVSAAKALATGQGYTVISLPEQKPQTVVPPLYPLLLSAIWRVYPRFPENIPWMMLLSVIATLSFLSLAYRYLVKMGYATDWQALIVVGMAGINWRTMLHGTSVMSEMVYAALAVGGLYLAERHEKEEKRYGAGIGGGVIIGLAFLTRNSGISLLMAIAVYFILRRRWKKALLPVGVASLFVITWMTWSYFSSSTSQGVNAAYYSNYLHGSNEIYSYLQGLNHGSRFTAILDVVKTNIILLVIGSIPLSCLGLRYDLPQIVLISLVLATVIIIAAGFIRQCRKRIRLLHVYLFIYLSMYLALPATAYDRYIVPVVPFLIFLLVSELSVPVSIFRKEFTSGNHLIGKIGAAAIMLVLLLAAGITFYSNGSAIRDSFSSLSRIQKRASESNDTITWIKSHTDPSDILVCKSDAIYFLYTDRKAVLSFQASLLDTLPYRSRPPEFEEITAEFIRTIEQSKGKYLILNSDDFAGISELYQNAISDFIRQHSEMFVPVFESTNKNTTIYLIQLM